LQHEDAIRQYEAQLAKTSPWLISAR